jgi:hypothetical protein
MFFTWKSGITVRYMVNKELVGHLISFWQNYGRRLQVVVSTKHEAFHLALILADGQVVGQVEVPNQTRKCVSGKIWNKMTYCMF